jgi:hypothetical protein
MNTQTQEALKMAIEALEMHVPYYVKDRGCEAINACKQALEQPAQEPVGWMMVHREPEHGAAYLTFNKPTREQKISHHPYELYTHPHQWQGLTDDETENILHKHYPDEWKDFAHAIEQALKEKNT